MPYRRTRALDKGAVRGECVVTGRGRQERVDGDARRPESVDRQSAVPAWSRAIDRIQTTTEPILSLVRGPKSDRAKGCCLFDPSS